MDDDGFVVITGRKDKKGGCKTFQGKYGINMISVKPKVVDYFGPDGESGDPKACIEAVDSLRKSLRECAFFKTMVEQLEKKKPIQKIIALGIGCIHHSQVSQYQYACIVELHSVLGVKSPIEIFDPVMDETDAEVVLHYGNKAQTVNEMGKRPVDELTLFYMPHCSFDLYNAIIWSNWGERLDNVIVVGNSFTRYESNMIKDDQRNSPSNCIFKLLPLWFEHLVMDGFPKGESPSLRFLFDAFHTTCVMRLKDGEKGASCGERPPEPECGGDVMRTVNSKLVEYVKEYENGKEK